MLSNFLSTNKYEVQFAQNEDDLSAAQRLRYEVFNVELGEGLKASGETRRDEDIYDDQCDHLLVIFRQTGAVIGTYRMQTFFNARRNNGLYTAKEFNLSTLPDQLLQSSVEVGRACISAEHRNGRVLFLLWRGLAKYMMRNEKRYLFGCCSLTSQSPQEAWNVMKYLEMHHHVHDKFLLDTTANFECPKKEPESEKVDQISLPQLFRLYMDLGAKVCSHPAMDREFKTIDYLVLLDVKKLDERTRMLCFN
jgi:putative hemolysin